MNNMGFKRAEWHSGLTYRQTCHSCKATLEYTDDILDFRPWFADGFVYCPQCRTPLRHSENLAINKPVPPVLKVVEDGEVPVQESDAAPAGSAKFCTGCGHPFAEADRFCSQCGKRR